MSSPVEIVANEIGTALDRPRRVIAALESAGFKIVGKEPTEEMMEAGSRARSLDYSEEYFGSDERVEVRKWVNKEWQAIFAAAPTFGKLLD